MDLVLDLFQMFLLPLANGKVPQQSKKKTLSFSKKTHVMLYMKLLCGPSLKLQKRSKFFLEYPHGSEGGKNLFKEAIH